MHVLLSRVSVRKLEKYQVVSFLKTHIHFSTVCSGQTVSNLTAHLCKCAIVPVGPDSVICRYFNRTVFLSYER